jgi:glycosyltransferase involved in cell wall biosynthesis
MKHFASVPPRPVSDKPRIAVIAPRGMCFSPLGATSIDLCIRDFVRFSRYRDSTTVIANHVENPFTDIDAQFVPKSVRSTQGRVREIVRLVRQIDPALVVIHQHLPTAARLSRQLRNCPIIFHVHNFQKEPTTRLARLFKTYSYRRLDAVVCVSDAVREHFLHHWGHAKVPAFTAHNGIDTVEWSADERLKEPLILFAGRAAPEKGVLEAARAVVDVLNRAPQWRAEFYLSEIERHQDYAAEVSRVLQTSGGRASLVVNATHDLVRDANARASVALVPSIYSEPFGRTAIEAMSAGCALVFSRRGGLPEVVGDAGIAIDEVSPDAIKAALLRLVNDAALRAEQCRLARSRCTDLFDIRRAAARVDEIYDTVLAEVNSRG